MSLGKRNYVPVFLALAAFILFFSGCVSQYAQPKLVLPSGNISGNITPPLPNAPSGDNASALPNASIGYNFTPTANGSAVDCLANGLYGSNACGGACKPNQGCTTSYKYPLDGPKVCYECYDACTEGSYYRDDKCGNSCANGQVCRRFAGICYGCSSCESHAGHYVDSKCNGECKENEVCLMTGDPESEKNYPDCHKCYEKTPPITTPVCGDGYITPPEECDPAYESRGIATWKSMCPEGTACCPETCKCVPGK